MSEDLGQWGEDEPESAPLTYEQYLAARVAMLEIFTNSIENPSGSMTRGTDLMIKHWDIRHPEYTARRLAETEPPQLED
ncbi:MAG TPA: hypothetical protein VLF91_00555 [Candidatus Saccharimonadales bacterium]|nr:hypothetical protein [Candidatus Saccharimonadales bacterium]